MYNTSFYSTAIATKQLWDWECESWIKRWRKVFRTIFGCQVITLHTIFIEHLNLGACGKCVEIIANIYIQNAVLTFTLSNIEINVHKFENIQFRFYDIFVFRFVTPNQNQFPMSHFVRNKFNEEFDWHIWNKRLLRLLSYLMVAKIQWRLFIDDTLKFPYLLHATSMRQMLCIVLAFALVVLHVTLFVVWHFSVSWWTFFQITNST